MDKPLPDTTSEGTTQSDTPETDAKELWGKYVMADFARSLERRLRAAEAEQRKIFSAEQAQIEAPLLARIKELEERIGMRVMSEDGLPEADEDDAFFAEFAQVLADEERAEDEARKEENRRFWARFDEMRPDDE